MAGVGVVGVLATGELTRSVRLSVGGVTCNRDGRTSGQGSLWLGPQLEPAHHVVGSPVYVSETASA